MLIDMTYEILELRDSDHAQMDGIYLVDESEMLYSQRGVIYQIIVVAMMI